MGRVERAVKRHLETRLLPGTPEGGLARPPALARLPAPGAKRALYVWKVANKRSADGDGGLLCDAVGQVKFISTPRLPPRLDTRSLPPRR